MKKVLIVLLIFAYMNCYLGCTSKVIITDKEVDTETNNDDLIVVTKDSIHYYFDANMYRFENDSLDGIAKINGDEQKQRVKIALEDIVRTGEVIKEIDSTWGLIGGIIGGTVLLFAVIVLVAMNTVKIK
jgi:hypothetical protein